MRMRRSYSIKHISFFLNHDTMTDLPPRSATASAPKGLSSGWDLIGLFLLSAFLIILLQILTARYIWQRPAPGSGNDNAKQDRSDLHLQRRIQHAATGLVFVGISYIIPPFPAALMLLVADVALFALHRSRLKSEAAQEMYMKLFGALLRPHERTNLPGAFYFVLGTAASLTFPINVARLSVLCLSLGDPVAAVVGTTIGGPKLVMGKSWSGTAACWGVCFVLGIGVMGFNASESAIAALFATLAELFSSGIGIDDNFLIPITTCIGLHSYRVVINKWISQK